MPYDWATSSNDEPIGIPDRYAQMAIDHGVEDDDPVLDSPNRCVDCGKLGTEVPVSIHDGDPEKRCDPCWARSNEYGRSHIGDECSDTQEILFEYHVKIGVRVKKGNSLSLLDGRLRAQEILLGLPHHDDSESWEHELISVTDAESGEEIPEP